MRLWHKDDIRRGLRMKQKWSSSYPAFSSGVLLLSLLVCKISYLSSSTSTSWIWCQSHHSNLCYAYASYAIYAATKRKRKQMQLKRAGGYSPKLLLKGLISEIRTVSCTYLSPSLNSKPASSRTNHFRLNHLFSSRVWPCYSPGSYVGKCLSIGLTWNLDTVEYFLMWHKQLYSKI